MISMQNKPLLIAMGAIAFAGLAYGGWMGISGNSSSENLFKTYTVSTGAVTHDIAANGTLNPVTLVSVGTQVSGTVKKLHVDFNSKVEKGQVLLELDNSLYAAQARQSVADLKDVEASLELALANERRMESLFRQEFVSRQEYDQAIQARKSATAKIAKAKAAIEKDGVNLGYALIRSPVSGVVVDRVVDVGQTVAASFQTPTLIKIAQDLTNMQIDSSFSEADIGFIQLGQNVRFKVDAFPNRNFQGEVRQIRINPTTVQNVVNYNVVVGVDNPDLKLFPGMTAYVSIAVAQKKDVLLVPNAALRYKPKQPQNAEKSDSSGEKGQAKMARKKDAGSGTVYVLSNDLLKPVSVTLGITDSRMTAIAGGDLKSGDVIVVSENATNGGVPAGSGSPMRLRLF
jgi:HlyD family secretion protein